MVAKYALYGKYTHELTTQQCYVYSQDVSMYLYSYILTSDNITQLALYVLFISRK